VLDHWVNYRQRFQRDGQELLPDQLWVADADAAILARKAFPKVPLLQLPNRWLENIRTQVTAIRASSAPDQTTLPRRPARRLLYLMEPIRVPWPAGDGNSAGIAPEAGEFQSLRYWLRQLPRLIELGWVAPKGDLEHLCLRPHPSEPPGKYNALIAEAAAAWPIRLDPAPTLAAALGWADVAFGCETQALVAAMACGLPSFSTVPPWAPPCRLPQSSLHHLSRLEST
jgi:hypothetical protein